MYEASFKTTDGETFTGWMGNEIPSKKGFHSIKLEVTGAIAFIPNEEVDGDVDVGKLVNADEITIKPPEKSKEIATGSSGGSGTYYKPKEVKPGSKLEAVVNIIRNNPGLARKEYIQLIVEQVGMTPAGASTYINNAKPFV